MSSFLRPGVASRRPSFLFITALATANVVAAQAPAEPPTLLDEVVVEGRAADLIGSAGSSSEGSVGYVELADRPFLRRGELLEVIPGVVITQHSGGGKANQYFLRGFNLDHGTDFAVSAGGMPVNLRSHAHGQGYTDLNFIIPEMVQSVDYTKGPFAARVGDFSSAGAADYHFFDALPANFVKLEAGEFGYTRAAAGVSRSAGDATSTVGFEAERYDGPWLLEDDFGRVNAFIRHSWGGGPARFGIQVMGYAASWNATDQIPLRAVESGELDRFGFVDPTNGGSTERASVSTDARWEGGSGITTASVYAIHYRLNLFSNFTYMLEDPVNGDQFNQRDKRVVVGGAIEHAWSGSERSEIKVGVQVRSDFISELGLHRTTGRRKVGTVRDDDVTEASAGLFADARYRITPRLRFDAGVRVDGYAFDVESDLAANSGDDTAAIASPKGGLVYELSDALELYANAGLGFHSNDARGVVISVDPVSGDAVDRVDPLVRSRGYETGLRAKPLPGWVSTVSLWHLDLDSELVFVGDAGGTEPTGGTRRYGVEWANYYRLKDWLRLDADLALTHARYRNAEGADRIANSISRVVTAGISADLPHGWFASIRGRYFGSQPLVEDDSVTAPSSVTFNGRLGFARGPWRVAVDVLNLLDRDNNDIAYAYESRLATESEAAEGLHFHPAEPRMVRVSVERTF